MSETDPELASATKKYYRSEAERLRLQESLKDEMPPFYLAMRQIIDRLWAKDIRFAVFNMEPDRNPPKIHVGMTVCCSKQRLKEEIITDELRREIAAQISGLTKYKEVYWAL